MTGLEKITSQIETDSNDRCREIIKNAESKAQKIIEDAELSAAKIEAEEKGVLQKLFSDAKEAVAASAQLKKNQALLSQKLSIIDETLFKAVEIIRSLPKKEYFDILKELAVKNALCGEGILKLSKVDFQRVPAGFIEGINSGIKEKGGSVILGESADIDSGFLLVYGDIDINCTFNSIISEKRDDLKDALNNLLFC